VNGTVSKNLKRQLLKLGEWIEGVLNFTGSAVILMAVSEEEGGPISGVQSKSVELHQSVGGQIDLKNPIYKGGRTSPHILTPCVAGVLADSILRIESRDAIGGTCSEKLNGQAVKSSSAQATNPLQIFG
jgi:hypothetical protein